MCVRLKPTPVSKTSKVFSCVGFFVGFCFVFVLLLLLLFVWVFCWVFGVVSKLFLTQMKEAKGFRYVYHSIIRTSHI